MMSGQIQEQLPELYALAHDKSESSRFLLAGRIADIFLTEGAELTSREEQMVNELIDLLLNSGSSGARNELIQKFANAEKMPRSLALHLAKEPIEIAGAVLATNPNFRDEDLVVLVETQSRDHASAIAARKEISEAVADALIVTGDLNIMQMVAENLGAKLTKRSMEVLVEAARLTDALQRPVINRPELNNEQAAKIYWWLSQDLRKAALARFGFSTTQMESSFARVIDDKLTGHLLEKQDDSAMYEVADWIEDRGALNTDLLIKLLRMNHYRLFDIALGRLCGLGLPLVEAIVETQGGKAIAAVCRALNVEKGSFISIFLLSRGARPNEQIVHPSELTNAIAAFDKISGEDAKAMISTWRENPEKLFGACAAK